MKEILSGGVSLALATASKVPLTVGDSMSDGEGTLLGPNDDGCKEALHWYCTGPHPAPGRPAAGVGGLFNGGYVALPPLGTFEELSMCPAGGSRMSMH